MNERWLLSRRRFLRTLVGTGVIAATDLPWWDAPLISPRRAWAAEPVRFQFSVPEPTRITLMTSLIERFNQSQKDFAVEVEFVPQAQARQKLISAISAGSPPDCCQVWDNWLGQFQGMGALEDLTQRVQSWKHQPDVLPTAWQTVTIGKEILSLPLSITLDGIYYRRDRLKEVGIKEPSPDWTWDDFLKIAQAFTKPDKNQYGYGMRGAGTWAVLYPSEFAYANGAQVLKDGKVVINSKEGVDALAWYMDLALKHKVTPPSAPTDGFVEIVETFGRGVTSMYQHNSGSVGQQKKNVGADNFATLPVPIGPAKTRASFYFSETLTAFKGARNKEGAWRFMSFMLEDEPSLMYCKTLGLLPARKSIVEQPEFKGDPALAGFLNSFSFSIVSPYLAYPGWGGRLDSDGVPLIQQAIVGKISPKECLDKFADILTKSMA
ncbi:MAG TPA: sugar ABC transporter substrate-binding protein [Stellaceae bacterium]|nr:sugar ABC transporter substrate-binding protein [Stellaceae bacterium]